MESEARGKRSVFPFFLCRTCVYKCALIIVSWGMTRAWSIVGWQLQHWRFKTSLPRADLVVFRDQLSASCSVMIGSRWAHGRGKGFLFFSHPHPSAHKRESTSSLCYVRFCGEYGETSKLLEQSNLERHLGVLHYREDGLKSVEGNPKGLFVLCDWSSKNNNAYF